MQPDGSPEYIKQSMDNCLKLLDGKKSIDIFEPARVAKNAPFEDTLKAMEEYVKAGKIGGIGISEVSAATVHKAAKVTKIVSCEVELSLWSLDILENGVAAACAEHNIPVVAYASLSSFECFTDTDTMKVLTDRSRHINGRDQEAGRLS